ncbi:MAG: thiamine pyrophosphate-binding protein, partial [Rhodobacterales bacterium]|nr:thiamine pyrophosphate-binding protein [Rhodobacterales bacterium]
TAPSAPAPGPDLDQARAWLAGAERPLMIAGVDAVNHDAGAAITAFARRFSVPVLTTYKGKGLMPEDDPLSLGGAGLSPRADTALMPLVEQADLILLAGYDPIEMRVGWCDPWPADKRVVAFSAVPNTHFVHPESLSFVGHVGAGLEALAQGGTPRPVWSNGAPGATRDELARLFPTDEAWGPAAIADTVCKSLPEHGIATVDTGAHRILLSQVWKAARPRGLLQSSGFCTMGPAMPQALGVKLADPDRPVVALVGDGGLEMMLGDLATARDLGLAVPIVVFADRSLALIEMKQRTSGLDNRGVDFGTTDFPAVARALGGRGVEATDRAALAAAVTEALSADRFTVIACPFDRKAYDGRF